MTDSTDDQNPRGEIDNDEVQSGVLGSLPRSRPTVRSPRRGRRTGPQAEPAPSPGPSAQRASEPEAPEADPATAEQPSGTAPSGGADHAQEQRQESGPEAEIEALARAGVSIATGAATLGLRTAARAAAALRDAVERR